MAAWIASATGIGERSSASPHTSGAGTSMRGSTSRRSASAKACAITRVPIRPASDMMAASSSDLSGGIRSEKESGDRLGQEAVGKELSHLEGHSQPLVDLLAREGAGPPGVGAGQDK